MSGGGWHGEGSAHIGMSGFEWLCNAFGLDFDDLLLVLGLDACSSH